MTPTALSISNEMPSVKDQVTLDEIPLKDIKVYEVHFERDGVGSVENSGLLINIKHSIKLNKNIDNDKDESFRGI